MKRLLIACGVVVVLVIGGVAAATALLTTYMGSPMKLPDTGLTFEVTPGTPFSRITSELAERGALERPRGLRTYARITGDAAKIRAGEYRIEAGSTPQDLLQQLVAGDVRLYSFTIVEGWNFRDLVAALADHPAIESDWVAEDASAILADLGADFEHPEGLFLPETYRIPKGTPAVSLLKQAHELLLEALEEEWAARATGLPIDDAYSALILASIIEKETALASERPRIAGVFVRRLQRDMRLQTDPTVIYGIGPDFNGNLTRRDLRTDTPYNTYTRKGLPPTPIAMAGRAAISAAVNPTDGNEIFFVATGLGDGSHKFSATKDEHDAAVQEYLRRQRQASQSENR